MDRREFLRLSALGVTAVSGIGCARSEARPLIPPSFDHDLFVQTLDRNMASLENPFDTVAKSIIGDPGRVPSPQRRFAEDAYRKQLRWMLLLGTVRELPLEQQAHPAIQERLRAGVTEIDESLSTMTDYLEKLPEQDRRAIQQKLRTDPDLPMRMAETLDRECAALGFPMQRRLELRQITSQVSLQLRAQPVSTFIDTNVLKLRKLAGRQVADQEREVLAAPESSKGKSSGTSSGTVLTIGGVLFGAGLGLGLLAVAVGGIGGVFIATPAILCGVGGLITLLVGAILAAVGR